MRWSWYKAGLLGEGSGLVGLSGLKGQGGAPRTQVSIPKGRLQEQGEHSCQRVKERKKGRKLCTGRPVCAPEAAKRPVIPVMPLTLCGPPLGTSLALLRSFL